MKSAVDSGVDFDDSEYIPSQDGNEDEDEGRDKDKDVDEDEDCDRKVIEKRMLQEQVGGEGGKKSKGECFWDEGYEKKKLDKEEEEWEDTIERNGSVLSIQSQSTIQSDSVMGNRYSLSKQSHLIYSMVVCMCTLVCMCCMLCWVVCCAVLCCAVLYAVDNIPHFLLYFHFMLSSILFNC